MTTWKATAPLLIACALAACDNLPQSAPQPVPLQMGFAQDVKPSNTMLGTACDGTAPDAGVHLTGDSLLVLQVTVNDVVNGTIQPFAQSAVPVDFFKQQLPRPVYVRGTSTASCTGIALRAGIRSDYAYEGRTFLDYVMEIAPNPPSNAQRPADPYRVTGSFEVKAGQGGADTTFMAGGHPLIVHFQASPGPRWREDKVTATAHAADGVAAPTYARPLPDELPGRTLNDVLNPAYARGTAGNPYVRLNDDRINNVSGTRLIPNQ